MHVQMVRDHCPPVDGFDATLAPFERAMIADMLAYSVVGTHDTVAAGLARIAEHTGADELMIAAQIYDHAARVRSYEIVAESAAGVAEARHSAAPDGALHGLG